MKSLKTGSFTFNYSIADCVGDGRKKEGRKRCKEKEWARHAALGRKEITHTHIHLCICHSYTWILNNEISGKIISLNRNMFVSVTQVKMDVNRFYTCYK